MNKFHSVADTIYNEHGRPVVTMPSSYWAERVTGLLNKEAMERLESLEKQNFSKLSNQEEEPAYYDSSYHPTISLRAG